MRHRLGCRFAAAFLLGAVALGIQLSGCSADDCEHKLFGCSSSAGGNGGGGGDGGSGGVIEPPPPGCEPSKEEEGGVRGDCGVFVSATGDDNAEGTKDAPLKSINEAIRRAVSGGTRRVYACATAGAFDEAVTVPAGVTIYGALDCENDWRWKGDEKTRLTAAAGTVPLTIQAARGSVHIEDVHVVAEKTEADPNDAATYGRSSIAAIADRGHVELVRCTLEANDAAPGYSEPSSAPPAAEPGANGIGGNDACSSDVVMPNSPPTNHCSPEDGDESRGGLGGTGLTNEAGDGFDGDPPDPDKHNKGIRGENDSCGNGDVGRKGDDGGSGKDATERGTISSAGYTGLSGEDGKIGKPGQGGGGGAGARRGSDCTGSTPGKGGASGGSGGAGGCGGRGGKGGGPGGSSIALVSIDAELLFQDVHLIAKAGGQGGSGAPGQPGGPGGEGGPGGRGATAVSTACGGGHGGKGGDGGRGGKGSDGHSLGIAYLGTPPPAEGVTFDVATAPGNDIPNDTLPFDDSAASP